MFFQNFPDGAERIGFAVKKDKEIPAVNFVTGLAVVWGGEDGFLFFQICRENVIRGLAFADSPHIMVAPNRVKGNLQLFFHESQYSVKAGGREFVTAFISLGNVPALEGKCAVFIGDLRCRLKHSGDIFLPCGNVAFEFFVFPGIFHPQIPGIIVKIAQDKDVVTVFVFCIYIKYDGCQDGGNNQIQKKFHRINSFKR